MKQQKDIYVPSYYIYVGRQTTSEGEKVCLHLEMRFAFMLRKLSQTQIQARARELVFST